MPRIFLIELALLLLPFGAFGAYRYFVAEAATEGRKAWPVHVLFGIGAALAVAFWLFFILSEERDRNACFEPDRFDAEAGEIIKGRQVPCDTDISQIGVPSTDDPGGEATGVRRGQGEPADADPSP